MLHVRLSKWDWRGNNQSNTTAFAYCSGTETSDVTSGQQFRLGTGKKKRVPLINRTLLFNIAWRVKYMMFLHCGMDTGRSGQAANCLRQLVKFSSLASKWTPVRFLQHFHSRCFQSGWQVFPQFPVFSKQIGIPPENLKKKKGHLLWPSVAWLGSSGANFKDVFVARTRKRLPCVKLTRRGHQKWKDERKDEDECRSDSSMTAAWGFCFPLRCPSGWANLALIFLDTPEKRLCV